MKEQKIEELEPDIESLRKRIKDVYPHLYEAACSPLVTKIVHGQRMTDTDELIDQFFMHFDNVEDQVMWNLQYSSSDNYGLK